MLAKGRNGRIFWLALAALIAQFAAAQSGKECAPCHRTITETYQQTGMGRSFYRPSPGSVAEGTYYHQASDSYFTMLQRNGRYYQRRYQLDPASKPVNVMEKAVD